MANENMQALYLLSWVVTGLLGYWFGYCQPASDRRLAAHRLSRSDCGRGGSTAKGKSGAGRGGGGGGGGGGDDESGSTDARCCAERDGPSKHDLR